ncbi:hypothetical protein [Streptomyces sp. NPDC049744]|uniref:hypothetical protein n=1 Tax=Streptomyces sp. NPDC049744 TaxID=3154359 RepID=UPI003421DA86
MNRLLAVIVVEVKKRTHVVFGQEGRAVTTPVESDFPEAPARARSGLSAAQLAAGLIAEELRTNAPTALKPSGARREEPYEISSESDSRSTPTAAERALQLMKNAVSWGGVQFRRAFGKSTFAEMIERQSEELKKEVGENCWGIVKVSKRLMQDIHNEVLPKTEDLIENKAKIKIDATRPLPPPTIYSRRAPLPPPPRSAPVPQPETQGSKRTSYTPDWTNRASFQPDLRAVAAFLNGMEPPTGVAEQRSSIRQSRGHARGAGRTQQPAAPQTWQKPERSGQRRGR